VVVAEANRRRQLQSVSALNAAAAKSSTQDPPMQTGDLLQLSRMQGVTTVDSNRNRNPCTERVRFREPRIQAGMLQTRRLATHYRRSWPSTRAPPKPFAWAIPWTFPFWPEHETTQWTSPKEAHRPWVPGQLNLRAIGRGTTKRLKALRNCIQDAAVGSSCALGRFYF